MLGLAVPHLPLGGFYHFGYVTNDLDSALESLKGNFGLRRYRRKFNAPWLEVVHAWIGDTQIEVSQLGNGAPQMYLDYIPEESGQLRLHHMGHRIDTLEQWDGLLRAIDRTSLATPLNVDLMDGNLRAVYVDTRHLIGVYIEYLFYRGSALNINADVPRND